MKTHIICTIMAAGLIAGCSERSDNMGGTGNVTDSTSPIVERHVGPKWSELPAAVQQTVKEKSPSGVVTDIDKKTRNGQEIYQFTFKEPGVNPKIQVAADGTLVKSDWDKTDTGLLPTDSAVNAGNG